MISILIIIIFLIKLLIKPSTQSKSINVIVPNLLPKFTTSYSTYNSDGNVINTGILKPGQNSITGIYGYIQIYISDALQNNVETFNINNPSDSNNTLQIVNNTITLPSNIITIINNIRTEITI
jgi:hypothetical protein